MVAVLEISGWDLRRNYGAALVLLDVLSADGVWGQGLANCNVLEEIDV